VIVDKQRRIRRFTPQARSILNVVASDVGRSLGDIRLNIEAPDLDQWIAEVIATLVPKEWETRDGSGRWYRVLIRPYRAAGAVDGAIVSLLDIETFKQHLREVQLAREKAELADRAKDQFLAVLSHELRTPLTSLLMQTQLLRDAGSDVMRRDRACGAIERSTKMQMKLIDDLLDVSRIVTGKLRVDLQPVSLVAAVEAALASIAGLAAGRSIELKVSLDQSLALVAGDRTRLEQIVLNLLGNALKFTPKGGRIDLSLEAVAGLAHLKIADNGIGIDPSFLPRIFERLTQTDASSTREHAGLGLGLAIVRHLVDAHGGTVRAESAGLGKGATLSVTLPLMSSTPTASSLQPPASREVQRVDNVVTSEIAGRRILVVEDDTAVREAIAETMARRGAIVKTAESATTGMLVFRRFRPEALVCDIAMPGEDGYVFIRKIRALGAERGGDVPALALTALAGEADRRRALGEGFQMYIAKPIEIAFLVQAMGQILRIGKAAPKARGRQKAQVKRDRPS
jgi:two-component system CheB/CheR fusion protein